MNMHRIPEPELMDDPVQASAYANADFNEPHNAFVEHFAGLYPDGDIRESILDLGCGPADISVRMAKRYPHCRIDGIDGAQAMLREGEARIQQEGLQGRIQLYQRRIPGDPPPGTPYPVIFSNSLLHHLHQPQVLWRYVRQHSTASGWIFVMDLARPDSTTDAEVLVNTYSGEEPDILRRDFYYSLCAAFTVDEVSSQLQSAGLGQLQVESVSDRHLIAYGRIS